MIALEEYIFLATIGKMLLIGIKMWGQLGNILSGTKFKKFD